MSQDRNRSHDDRFSMVITKSKPSRSGMTVVTKAYSPGDTAVETLTSDINDRQNQARGDFSNAALPPDRPQSNPSWLNYKAEQLRSMKGPYGTGEVPPPVGTPPIRFEGPGTPQIPSYGENPPRQGGGSGGYAPSYSPRRSIITHWKLPPPMAGRDHTERDEQNKDFSTWMGADRPEHQPLNYGSEPESREPRNLIGTVNTKPGSGAQKSLILMGGSTRDLEGRAGEFQGSPYYARALDLEAKSSELSAEMQERDRDKDDKMEGLLKILEKKRKHEGEWSKLKADYLRWRAKEVRSDDDTQKGFGICVKSGYGMIQKGDSLQIKGNGGSGPRPMQGMLSESGHKNRSESEEAPTPMEGLLKDGGKPGAQKNGSDVAPMQGLQKRKLNKSGFGVLVKGQGRDGLGDESPGRKAFEHRDSYRQEMDKEIKRGITTYSRNGLNKAGMGAGGTQETKNNEPMGGVSNRGGMGAPPANTNNTLLPGVGAASGQMGAPNPAGYGQTSNMMRPPMGPGSRVGMAIDPSENNMNKNYQYYDFSSRTTQKGIPIHLRKELN